MRLLPGRPHARESLLKSKRGGAGDLAVELFAKETPIMDHLWTRVISQLAARVSGPMKFRLVLQPAMAAFFAIRSGLADAAAGKPPYFWCLLSSSGERKDMLKDGWKSISRVFILAVALDCIYQVIVLHFIYIGETFIVAFLLAILPYLIVRGLVTRVARRNALRRHHGQPTPLGSSPRS
jgi:hypothetical protein